MPNRTNSPPNKTSNIDGTIKLNTVSFIMLERSYDFYNLLQAKEQTFSYLMANILLGSYSSTHCMWVAGQDSFVCFNPKALIYFFEYMETE